VTFTKPSYSLTGQYFYGFKQYCLVFQSWGLRPHRPQTGLGLGLRLILLVLLPSLYAPDKTLCDMHDNAEM